jgi:hypothetical protein
MTKVKNSEVVLRDIIVPAFILKQAMINAKAKKYNRTVPTFTALEQVFDTLSNELDEHLKMPSPGEVDIYHMYLIPITAIMFHHHRMFEPCETHVRVVLNNSPMMIVDLALDDYCQLVRLYDRLTKKSNVKSKK